MKTKVILVVFDGCRPDGLAQAHTPHVDCLWQNGAYSWSAQSVAPSWSLPTHMSMFRGVEPGRHGVLDNTFQPGAAAFPSMMDVAHAAGLSTAAFYSWEELRDLSAHGSLDVSYCRSAYVAADADQLVAEQAAAHLVAEQPDLAFVYLCKTDLTGHDHGWMSAPYLAAVEYMDRALGHVLDALDTAGLRDQYALLLLADHGGHDHNHGTALPEDLTIPWILSGPRIKRGHAIQQPVRIMDTAATITHLLGLTLPDSWEGRPVMEALDE